MDSFSWYEGNRQRYYVPWESYRSYHQQLRGGGVKSQRYQHDESSSYYVPTKLRGGSETDWEWTGSEWKAAGASKKYKKIVEKDPRWRGGKRDKYITKQARGRMEDVHIGELDPEEDYTQEERDRYKLLATEWHYRYAARFDPKNRARNKSYNPDPYNYSVMGRSDTWNQEWADWRSSLTEKEFKEIKGRGRSRVSTSDLQRKLEFWQTRVGNRRWFDRERRENEAEIERIRLENEKTEARLRAKGLQEELEVREQQAIAAAGEVAGTGDVADTAEAVREAPAGRRSRRAAKLASMAERRPA